MFPYTVKYTESEYDTQNNDLLYKIDLKMSKYLRIFEKQTEKTKVSNFFFIIYKNRIIYIL